MSFGDADTILTEFSNDIKYRVSTKANQGLTAQQIANAKANIDIDKVPNVATNDQTPTFLEESTRTNIASGDKLSLIFGKIKKFFSDLKAVAFSGSYNDLSNKPTIPSQLSDLTDDTTHRTVSDTEKTTWNGKANKKTTMDSYYGTSSTGADTAAKVITVTDGGGNFSLRAGIAITVKFAAQNTAQNPTFNVNNTGAKSVWYNAAVITTGNLWAGGNTRPARYVYDGTYWVWMGHAIDNNTTYSAMSKAELTTGTATSSRTVRADYLKSGIEELIDGKIAGKADKSLLEEGNAHFQFGVDANGNYGYHKTVGGADTVIPFKTVGTRSGAITANGTYTAKTDISKDGYESVTVSVSPNLQSKTVAAGTTNVTVTADASYDGLSSVVVQPTPSQTKSVTPSTSAQTISPDSGKLLSSVSVGAISTQTKSATPSTSAQTITPDSGKYLSSVSISAISTQEKTVTAGTSATNVTPDSGKFLSKVTVNPTPSQGKTANVSHDNQTILPDSGKLLSQVIVWGKYTVNTLWTHSATSSYSGGTISIPNMKNYKYIVIYGVASTSGTGYKSVLGGFDPNDVGTAYNPNNGYVNFTSHAVLRSYGSNDTIRLVNVGTNKITISDLIGFSGGDGKPYGSNMRYNTSARGNVIPTKIEGIIAI